ncbi:MAG: deoxyguanosinetriphosphate triphosphohydrolase [Rhodospirillaceae bacterium]|jgi:dGTPase|nr:deoxyguanosinetriphosphate triphosphohydrolase [Rhodospirillaceae bacterium]MBT6116562.1 deoxyguanosinetriphosphate triphosphohydrolase [Rhodospirillaceae bacterium]
MAMSNDPTPNHPAPNAPIGVRACYATRPNASRGRLHAEPEDPGRSPFQRDRDRIIHSTAFRRLQYKTQVFVYHEGDHYRTRLTHSLEVSQIARGICRRLGLDEDLGEAVALAHDLGHTPFGHAGEEALDAAMAPYGGFDHNAHALRLVTELERRYAAFDGLNLTWETLEGLAKHNGPIAVDAGEAPEALATYLARHDLEVGTWPGPEAQIAALADDIAYNNHDLDDGLRAGLFEPEDLADLPLVGDAFATVADLYPDIERPRMIHEAVRRLIHALVEDLVAETKRRAAAAAPRDVVAVRSLGRPLAGFSSAMTAKNKAIKDFLYDRMYRHPRVTDETDRAAMVVRDLFTLYLSQPNRLPPDWREEAADAPDTRAVARIVGDYIAGMTDRFAFGEHEKMTN